MPAERPRRKAVRLWREERIFWFGVVSDSELGAVRAFEGIR